MSTAVLPAAAPRDHTRRNVLVLALCQALAVTGNTIMGTMAALVGYALAEDKSLATLPLALQFAVAMLATIPASVLMRRIGRRAGFSLGAVAGVAGMLVSAWSIVAADFGLFLAAALPIGIFNAFAQFYRFAAADTASEAYRPRAISLVLAGGVLAALLGPELAKLSQDWVVPFTFAGCYLAVAGLLALSLLLLQLVSIPTPTAAEQAESGRSLLIIMAQRGFIVAALSAAVGFSIMSLVMTATPLAMAAHGFGFDDTAFIIQWHVLAMFAPSFVTGRLIARFGAPHIILLGAVLLVASLAVDLWSVELWAFWAGLVLLGLGWNFMYVGGSSLLTEVYEPAERNKVQAVNDFLVFTAVALASYASGVLHSGYGWQAVNLAVLPIVAAALVVVVWFIATHPSRTARPA